MRSLLCPALVGRDAALARAAAVLRQQSAQHVVAVLGPAGHGKTTLVGAAAAGAHRVVLRGRATPDGAPLRPLAEVALDAVAAGADLADPGLAPLRGGLAALLPGTVQAPAPGTPAPTGPAFALVAAEALLRLVGTLGRPTTVVFEDLHWADAETLGAVERICDRVADRPVTVALAARPGGAAEGVARRLVARRAAELVEVAPLDAGAVAAMAALCLGAPAPGGLLRLLDAADGNPFEVEELLRTAHDAGALTRDGTRWVFDEDAAVPPPRTLADSVTLRLADLPGARVLEVAAALGGDLPPAVVCAAAGVDAATYDRAVAAGAAAQLLDPAGGAVRFRHALTAEVVAARLPPHLRAQAAATALRAAAAGRLPDAALAALALAAGDMEAAARHLRSSAQAHAAPGAAVADLRQALELTRDPTLRCRARVDLVEHLALAGRERDALDLAAVAAEDPHLTTGEQVRVDLATARCASSADVRDAAVRRAVAVSAGGPLEGATAAAAALLAIDGGNAPAAVPLARRALDLSGQDPKSRCQALEVLGRAARGEDLDQALEWFTRAAATARAHELPLWLARALHEKATILQLRTGSIAELLDAREAATAAGAPGLVASVDFHIAAVLASQLDPAGALAAARRLVELAATLDNRRQQAWGWLLVCFANTLGGRWAHAATDAEQSARLGVADGELDVLRRFFPDGLEPLLKGEVAAAAVGYWQAMRQLAARDGLVSPLPPWHLGALVCTVADVHGQQARALADRPELQVAAMCRAPLLLARAVAAGRAGSAAQAAELAGQADTVWSGAPGFAGYQVLGRWLAAADAHRDGWGDARTWLFDAQQWAAARGYGALTESCRALLRQLGAVPKRVRGAGELPEGLRRLGVTHREAQVLELLAQGLTNAGVAQRLHVSPGTVKGYVSALLAKTGAGNRAGLARIAAQHLPDQHSPAQHQSAQHPPG